MATPIKRIEKDFLLKVLFDEQIPMMMHHVRTDYILFVDSVPKNDLRFRSDKPITGVREGTKFSLVFDYRGQTITFIATVMSVKDGIVIAESPEFLYKNLSRSYSRVSSPSDMKVVFSFRGERYSLAFPRTEEYVSDEIPEYSDIFNPKDIKELINQLSVWAFETSSGHKLVMFKDAKPASIEERIISETGKTLFIPSTQTDLPEVDTGPKKRIITDEVFRRYIESSGTDKMYVDETAARFMKSKRDAGIYSDVWSPIHFQEYVIGYIRLWIDEVGKPPFDLSIIDTIQQFAKVLAYSLKINGYFKAAQLKNEQFEGKVIDVSASGLLFAHPKQALAAALLVDSELDIQLTTAKRVVKTGARIVRRYKDSSVNYFGCRYTDIAPEDLRFIFEYIYGKPFTDADASVLIGRA
ncbi:MAG: pilus assembly protein PilZ [Treponema sp. GWB1_62_6]|nr:MAG: pilus assembly protein PilZ [Treponema sp. GWC1_61_84]OHE67116.1 MAG: pilus assembly protein PilZ [Treponema sp. GWB1_62_6]OHE77055.1 MAG: pilus assembly protein PilZ [Treponema sp. RIFOXYC1_FULL_61_9]HCM25226.1 PilZ domain-containing protein [Treponema sp.]